MIKIFKNPNCDTRTCDVSKVTKQDLDKNSLQHIQDVQSGLAFLASELHNAGARHDYTKIDFLDSFYNDFRNGFKEGHQDWWNMHRKLERHHLKDAEYVQDDVNLIDILEMIVDGVMAGLARTGEYRKEEISNELLRKAFDNTIDLLLENVQVIDPVRHLD